MELPSYRVGWTNNVAASYQPWRSSRSRAPSRGTCCVTPADAISRSRCARLWAVTDEHPSPPRRQNVLLHQRRQRANQHVETLVLFQAADAEQQHIVGL